MIGKLRSTVFEISKKISNDLTGTGIGRVPGVTMIYELLFWRLFPPKDVIEIQGSKMHVDINHKSPSMRRTFRAYALKRVHEESTTELFEEVVKDGDIVVDLGANIGYFTLLAAKLSGKRGTVYAFEPEPTNYHYLQKNIELNGYSNVKAFQKAVGDEAGKVKLYVCPYDTGHHTINQYGGIEAYKPGFVNNEKNFVEVEKIALDDFFQDIKSPIDVIKMDVEGAEMLALLGMDRIIRESNNLRMFVEFFPLLIREMGDSPEEFIGKLLNDYQFAVSVIGADYTMRDYDSKNKCIEINNVDEVMNLCKGRSDHINLFLEKRGHVTGS